MSLTREPVAPTPPVAAMWKASSYQLDREGYREPQTIKASPGASWSKVDVFDSFKPAAGKVRETEDRGPHVWFLGLKTALENLRGGKGNYVDFSKVCLWFAHKYGLLGLFNETFAEPILPSRVDRIAWVAPDAVLDEEGRLRMVDPATEGKERLVTLMHERPDPTRTSEKLTLASKDLALPHELSFSSETLTPFGLLDWGLPTSRTQMFSWEEARNLYGVHAVLDEQARWGVSIISTREPLQFWMAEMQKFPVPPCTSQSLNRHKWSVEPHSVDDKDGKPQRSWRCSSLLQAMYMMLFLDETSDEFEIRKCQAPNCPNYFRVRADDGRSLKSIYCPPPPGRKQSKCAARASSKMHRDRQRRKI